ncbi:hypothetical protein BC941DRAFT_475509 [Chlamydoabsidia padenii]|nr:hypothetical protein BC941DRAFT_475509 [Chlamydoabsidia padenii]
MQVESREITAKQISALSRTTHDSSRLQYQKRKNQKALKDNNDEDNSISVIEQNLSELGEKMSEHEDFAKRPLSNITTVHRLHQHFRTSIIIQPGLKSKKKERNRFTTKAYGTKQGSGQDVEKGKAVAPHCMVFYGDAGRGFGTRIKGHIKKSTKRLQLHLKSKCDVISTSECLSLKLCCLCNNPVQHPKQRTGRVVQHINPGCFGRKHGFSLHGRDKNAAVNILKIGLYKAVIQNNYPAFSATLSSTTTTAD